VFPRKREEDELARQEREKDEREAAREAERIRQEMEERLKREGTKCLGSSRDYMIMFDFIVTTFFLLLEEERVERKKRVEAIMSRTRKAGPDSAK